MTMWGTAEDVQALLIAQPVPTAQDVDIVVVVELVGFVEEVLPEEFHHQADPVKKVSLKNTSLLIHINPQKQNPVNRQRCLLIRLISTLIPTTDILQE